MSQMKFILSVVPIPKYMNHCKSSFKFWCSKTTDLGYDLQVVEHKTIRAKHLEKIWLDSLWVSEHRHLYLQAFALVSISIPDKYRLVHMS